MVLGMEVVMAMEEAEKQEQEEQEQEQEQEQEHRPLKVEGQPTVVEGWLAENDIAPYYLNY